MSRRIRAAALAAVAMLLAYFPAIAAATPPPPVSSQAQVRLYPGTARSDNANTALLACFDTVTGQFQYASTTYPCQVAGIGTSGGGSGGGSSSGGYTPVSAAPRSTTATIASGQPVQLIAATAGNAARSMFSITVPAAGDSDLACTDDGTTPSATNADFLVYAHANAYFSAPQFVSNQAIICFAISGTAHVTAEVYP